MKKKLTYLLFLISLINFGCSKEHELHPESYDAFPLFIQTSDNNVQLYYRHGTSHVGNNGVIAAKSSSDGGKTFSTPNILLADSGIDVRNVSGGITSINRMILFVLKYNATTKIGLSQGYIYSNDVGKTWSAYQQLPTNNLPIFSPYGQLITIGNGKIMQGWYGTAASGTHFTYVIMSDDNGVTWSPAIQVAASTTIQYSEASYAYLDNGVIIGLVRDDRGAALRQVVSLDNGQTWSDQGGVTFDNGIMVSPCLSTYTNAKGEKYVIAYYANRKSIYLSVAVGTYSGLKAGVSGWITSSLKKVGGNYGNSDFGYPSVVNLGGTNMVRGVYYRGYSKSSAGLDFFTFTPSY
jgi:hypothetical protein